jgi:hypothetical protein
MSTFPYTFMTWLLIKHRERLTFAFVILLLFNILCRIIVCSRLNILKWVRLTNWNKNASAFQSVLAWKHDYMIPIKNIACYGIFRRSFPHSVCILLPPPRFSPWHCAPNAIYFSTKCN